MIVNRVLLIGWLLHSSFGTIEAADSVPSGAAAALWPSTSPTGSRLIDLPTVLRLAGAQSLDVQIARQRLALARAERESALWQFFPWLSPGVSYRRHDNLIQDVAGNIVDVHKEAYSVGPTMTGQLDLGEAIYRKLAADQVASAAAFGFNAQQQETVLTAALAYFDLLGAQAVANVAAEAIAISTNYSAQIRQATAAGIAFRGDLLRVEVQTERRRLTWRQAQERSLTAGARLVEVLHLKSEGGLVPLERDLVAVELLSPGSALDPLIAQALHARPELKEQQATLRAAREVNRGAVYGPLVPSVNAQAFAGGLGGGTRHGPSEFGESEDYQVSLGWRIGPGGLFDSGRKRATDARVQIAALTGAKLEDEIVRQVVEAHNRVGSLADQIAVAQRAVQLAEEGLRLAQQRKEFAVGAVLEDIQAQQDLTQARTDLVTAIAEHNKAQYTLQRAIGALR